MPKKKSGKRKKQSAYKPTRKEVEEWKSSLSKRSLRKYQSLKSTKKKHEYMLRSMAGKRGYQSYIIRTSIAPIIKTPIETEADIYEGIISEIYATFGDTIISRKLEDLMNITMTDNDITISEYIGKVNLNKISEYIEVIKRGSPRKNGEDTSHHIMALAEELALNDLSSFDREELSNIIEQEY